MRSNHVRHLAQKGLVFLLLFLAALAPAGTAAAALPDPTLSLEELQGLLEPGDPLPGHMKTTMKGYTVEEIPVAVHALVENAWGTLILFEASSDEIDAAGGIAVGMSGSPVYVNHGGISKLIGAVSYGDAFTRGGVGLATPIEYMTATQASHVPALAPKSGTYSLDEPTKTESGVISKVTIARNAKSAARVRATSDETVMAPLALMEIGGLPPRSHTFRQLAARLESRGLTVRAAAGAGTWTGGPAPPLEAGSPCVVMFSTGAVWFGVAGTITYVDDDEAMMLGHAAWWVGPTHASLNAGYVSGVWPSTMTPYKLIAPRDAKGAVTQDRYWGVLGLLGQTPDMFPVTTRASYPDEGREVTDSSSMSQWFVTQPAYSDIPAYATLHALTAANDVEYYAGSAETTTTVVVSDSTGTYTVRRSNLWDTADDVATEASWDVSTILSALSENPDGLLQPHVESVELDAVVSPERRSARFAAVLLPQGLHTGDNEVVVHCYPYGSGTVEEYSTTLTLPAGMRTNGFLSVVPGSWNSWYDDYDYTLDEGIDFPPPKTLADVVAELNQSVRNSDLIVTYIPAGLGNDPEDPSESVTSTIETPYVFRGEFWGETADIELLVDRSTLPYAGIVGVAGYVADVTGDIEVDIYRKDAGRNTERFVKTVTAKARLVDAFFRTAVGPLRRNTTIIARTRPTSTHMTGSASAPVRVRAGVNVGVRTTSTATLLRTRVRPAAARGTLRLERRTSSGWVLMKKAAWQGETITLKVGRGARVLRVRAVGLDICASGVSRTIRPR